MNQPTYQAPVQTNTKVSDPFWFRKNHSYLFGVTSNPSNPLFGINNITLREASAKQTPHGFLYNGMLSTAVGTMAFQIRVSKNNAPMVTTESRKSGVDEQGKDKYFEAVQLNAVAKAQILRFMEAVRSGQFQQAPVQQQQFQQAPQQQFQQVNPYQAAPQQQFQQAPQYQAVQQQVPQYSAPVQHNEPPAPAYEVAGQNIPVGSGAPVTVGDDDLPF